MKMVMPNVLIVVDVCKLVLFAYRTFAWGETGVVNVDLLD
jgi:hypothetical protein